MSLMNDAMLTETDLIAEKIRSEMKSKIKNKLKQKLGFFRTIINDLY